MATAEAGPFGALLLRLRAAAGLTQEQLAARAGLSPKAVAALERGKRRSPRAVTVELLADALGLEAAARAHLVSAARAVVPAGSERGGNAARNVYHRPWRPVAEPTPLVDRARELDTIMGSLAIEGVRLLTLTCPAGVGKTRLALITAASPQLADRFPDGVVWVDLAPVRHAQGVLEAICRALG